jgi:hypothetical protein
MDSFIVINKNHVERLGIGATRMLDLIITFEPGTTGFEIVKNRYNDKIGEATELEITDLLRRAWGERASITDQIQRTIDDNKKLEKDLYHEIVRRTAAEQKCAELEKRLEQYEAPKKYGDFTGVL